MKCKSSILYVNYFPVLYYRKCCWLITAKLIMHLNCVIFFVTTNIFMSYSLKYLKVDFLKKKNSMDKIFLVFMWIPVIPGVIVGRESHVKL